MRDPDHQWCVDYNFHLHELTILHDRVTKLQKQLDQKRTLKEIIMGKNRREKKAKRQAEHKAWEDEVMGRNTNDDQLSSCMDECCNPNAKAEEAKRPTNQLVLLTRIVEPNPYAEAKPVIKRETISVAADAVDVIEPAQYDIDYAFVQDERPMTIGEAAFRTMSGVGRMQWRATGTAPCVAITTSGGENYLIDGDVEVLTRQINLFRSE